MIDTKFTQVESLLGSLLVASRLDRALRRARRGTVPILMYHSVTADSARTDTCLTLAGMTVRESLFREHMEYIARHYTTVSLTDYVQGRDASGRLPENPCVITFDDGFADVYHRALPILRELGLRATVFVITSTLDGSGSSRGAGPWLHDLYAILDAAGDEAPEVFADVVEGIPASAMTSKESLRPWARGYFASTEPPRRAELDQLREKVGASSESSFLTVEELHQLMATGFEIGSHSMNHEYLAGLSDGALVADIAASRQLIEPFLGGSAPTFCYPFGGRRAWDDRTVRALRDQGFSCAVATVEGLNSGRNDLYGLRRIRVTGDLSLSAFAFRLLGLRAMIWRLDSVITTLRRRSSR